MFAATQGVRMTLRGRIGAIWGALVIALSIGAASPAAAQDTPGEYRTSIDNMFLEIRALWGEIDRFKVEPRYCNPSPPPPSKAQAQAELAALEKRVTELNGRYNALKQSLLNFLDHNHRLYSEMMVNGRDPRDRQWWSRDDNNRQRMLDALARKKAALAAAPEVDCRPKPKPKPKPAVTTGGFQPPALPVRPSPTSQTWPAMPAHFCSYDEKIEFLKKVGALLDEAGADAERAARFRTEVEQAVNSYVQNDRPVPPELIARRRQAIADVEAANRRVREANDNYNRANAIPVIDCRTPVKQDPPRTQPPRQDTQTGQSTPRQGLDAMDEFAIGRQQGEIEAVEKALADLREFRRQGNCAKAWELAEDLDEWLDELSPEPANSIRSGYMIPKPKLPPGQLEKWSNELDDIMEDCPEPGSRLDVSTILNLHNAERATFGYQPLRWSFRLADNAQDYADHLANTGQRVHASRAGRGIERENLSQGMLGWNSRQLIGSWLAEKPYFRPGIFPNVSTTGDWYKVGHYSQMIWPTTISIGCGLAYGKGYSWMVCRYSPGGNKDGKAVGLPQMPSPRHVVASTPPVPQRGGGVAGGGNVVANQDGIAPPNSSTPTNLPFDPRSLPRLPVGGGMTQIDPPPPPPPTARDDAPEGREENHPLVRYAQAADAQHATETDCGNAAMARLELEKMRYALDELKKRLKDAKKARRLGIGAVNPDDVQRQIDDLERRIREAEQRKPRGACPLPPAPQQRGMVNQPGR